MDLCVPGEKLAHADDGTDGRSCGPVSVHSVKEGKALIKAACDKLGLSQERHALYIAMAMQVGAVLRGWACGTQPKLSSVSTRMCVSST